MKALLKAGFPLLRPFVLATLLGAALLGVVRGQSASLIGWWKLDDAFGADSSGFTNHGVLGFGVTVGVPGPNGTTAFHFDGGPDSRVTIPTPLAPATTAITASAWVNADDFACWHCAIVSNEGYPGDNTFGYGIRIIEGGTLLQVCWGTQDGPGNCAYGAYAFPTGTWTHVAGSYDGSVIRGYVNGVLIVEKPGVFPALDTSRNLTIGRLPSATLSWRGSIADVRVYDRPLSHSEIGDLFAGAADTDADDDGVLDGADNCPAVSNANQLNTDADAQGDACDSNDDNDAYLDSGDRCPLVQGPYFGCPLDWNSDGDSLLDVADNCPTVPNNDQLDFDRDGVGDVCDLDVDGDRVDNVVDSCPWLIGPRSTGGCPDTDGDNVGDFVDNCPLNKNTGQLDTDLDGQGDVCDLDADNDRVFDEFDNCPAVANPDQGDADLDGKGNVCDTDDDNDGILDTADNCPFSPNSTQANVCPATSKAVRQGFDQYTLPMGDDSSTTAALGFAVTVANLTYRDVNVNVNGSVSFGRGFADHVPKPFPVAGAPPLFAPFWADVMSGQTCVFLGGTVTYTSTITYGRGAVNGRPAFAATWRNAQPPGCSYPPRFPNTFQVVIVERSDRGDNAFDVEFNYDATQWDQHASQAGCATFGYQLSETEFYPAGPRPACGTLVSPSYADPPGLQYRSNLVPPVPGRQFFAFQSRFDEAASGNILAGGVLTTSAAGALPTALDPVETTVRPSVAGPVSITERAAPPSVPAGYTMLGQMVTITAPPGTAQSPIEITFDVVYPSTYNLFSFPNLIVVRRNGAPVLPCVVGVAPPFRPILPIVQDPCRLSTTVLAPGVARIVVLTSRASDWDFLAPLDQPAAEPPTPENTINELIAVLSNLEGLQAGRKTALTNQAEAIRRAIIGGRDVAAKALLRAFINEIHVLDALNRLPGASANQLIGLAETLIDQL